MKTHAILVGKDESGVPLRRQASLSDMASPGHLPPSLDVDEISRASDRLFIRYIRN